MGGKTRGDRAIAGLAPLAVIVNWAACFPPDRLVSGSEHSGDDRPKKSLTIAIKMVEVR